MCQFRILPTILFARDLPSIVLKTSMLCPYSESSLLWIFPLNGSNERIVVMQLAVMNCLSVQFDYIQTDSTNHIASCLAPTIARATSVFSIGRDFSTTSLSSEAIRTGTEGFFSIVSDTARLRRPL